MYFSSDGLLVTAESNSQHNTDVMAAGTEADVAPDTVPAEIHDDGDSGAADAVTHRAEPKEEVDAAKPPAAFQFRCGTCEYSRNDPTPVVNLGPIVAAIAERAKKEAEKPKPKSKGAGVGKSSVASSASQGARSAQDAPQALTLRRIFFLLLVHPLPPSCTHQQQLHSKKMSDTRCTVCGWSMKAPRHTVSDKSCLQCPETDCTEDCVVHDDEEGKVIAMFYCAIHSAENLRKMFEPLDLDLDKPAIKVEAEAWKHTPQLMASPRFHLKWADALAPPGGLGAAMRQRRREEEIATRERAAEDAEAKEGVATIDSHDASTHRTLVPETCE